MWIFLFQVMGYGRRSILPFCLESGVYCMENASGGGEGVSLRTLVMWAGQASSQTGDGAPCRSASLSTPVAWFCSLARVMGKFYKSPAVFMLLFCRDMGGGEQVPVLGTRVETVRCRGLLRESWYLRESVGRTQCMHTQSL